MLALKLNASAEVKVTEVKISFRFTLLVTVLMQLIMYIFYCYFNSLA